MLYIKRIMIILNYWLINIIKLLFLGCSTSSSISSRIFSSSCSSTCSYISFLFFFGSSFDNATSKFWYYIIFDLIKYYWNLQFLINSFPYWFQLIFIRLISVSSVKISILLNPIIKCGVFFCGGPKTLLIIFHYFLILIKKYFQ